MKENTKKLAAAAACGLIAVAGAGASAAYLTDGETVTNTFTVGKVSVDLTEPGYTPENDVPRVPNQEILKNPTVTNTGNNDEIVFISFDIPMGKVKIAGHDGRVQGEKVNQELFDFRSEKGAYDSVNEGWILLGQPVEVDKNSDGTADYKTYVYGYRQVVRAAVLGKEAVGKPGEDGYQAAVRPVERTVVPPIFHFIRLANIVEGQLDSEKLTIPVRAYAIQADYLQSADHTGTNHNISVDGVLDEKALTQIFNIYKNQNDTQKSDGGLSGWTGIESGEEKKAGAGNALDLTGNSILP